MKQMMMIALLALVSWGASAQGHVMFKDGKTGTAYEHYAHLKDALVASNQGEAKKAAEQLQKALASVKDGKKASDEVVKIVSASSLDNQRLAFSSLSNEMATLITGNKISMGEVYLDYCPMANNNKGAFWLSNEKAIKNPYFGDMMLKCGSVKETIQ